MKVDLKLFAIAIFLLAIPVLMALPQSFLVSDVVLSNNLSSKQGQGQQTPDEERRMPLFGKITAIHNASLEISNANGDTVTVKITSQTEFRKDRQAAKRSDFKSAAPQVFAKLRQARNFAVHRDAFRPFPACVAIVRVQ